jgi:hypothetical protein
MASGARVRLLLEWYDPDWTEADGNNALTYVTGKAKKVFRGAELQGYVEMNPPDDEVEGAGT